MAAHRAGSSSWSQERVQPSPGGSCLPFLSRMGSSTWAARQRLSDFLRTRGLSEGAFRDGRRHKRNVVFCLPGFEVPNFRQLGRRSWSHQLNHRCDVVYTYTYMFYTVFVARCLYHNEVSDSWGRERNDCSSLLAPVSVCLVMSAVFLLTQKVMIYLRSLNHQNKHTPLAIVKPHANLLDVPARCMFVSKRISLYDTECAREASRAFVV